jgi:dienelactone hydrolase
MSNFIFDIEEIGSDNMLFNVSRIASHLKVALLLATLALGACSNGSDSDVSGYPAAPQDHAVGITSRTFVDTSRSTPAHGNMPEKSSRTIETTIVYPVAGMSEGDIMLDATVDTEGGPFPLVVLSHGLGGSPASLVPLASRWASRGYVVALPAFPLTNSKTPGGAAQQDTQNQPGDVSFLIDEVLAESASAGLLLSDAVDGEKIAASGHSNGGLTTYGVAVNSCCRDQRVGAAIILSGVPAPYAGGDYDPSIAPPILSVHGVNDVLLSFNEAVRFYNQLLPPKGFLTLEEYDHGSYLLPDDPAFDVVASSTADFLDGELRSDDTALAQLVDYQVPGLATMHWAPDDASNVPVETAPEPETNRQAFLSADSGLVDGQVITVTWSGYLPGRTVNVIQCTDDPDASSAACNISGGKVLYPNPLGSGSLELVVRTGPVGNGVCDSANSCVIVVNDSGLTAEGSSVRIPITFAE